MILLNGHSLTPARKVPVEAESLQLKERDSTATLTPADMAGIGVNSWLKDEGEPGNGIVWRVKSIGQAFATATPTVQLEHLIASLKDTILFGEHKPAQITGNKNATTCTAEQAVRYVLARQSDWTLGSFSYGGVSNPYKFDGDTLFDCLETISNSLTDAWWSYDFSRYPFRLNITQKSATVQSEMRASRNLKAITKTIDKSGMYTRFYPIGKNDLHIDGDYVERNVSAYGVISKVETDQSIDTKAELVRWANERLKMHAEPTVNIDVDGVELAAATGESMDKLTLGTVCRIPLPEFGTTIQERIVSLSYPDKVHQPEIVKIQLSNTRQDLTKILADAIKSGGRGGRASAKREKEDLAWFEDTNDHVAMCAKGIVGVDAAGNPNWVRLSQIYVDGNGIDQTVSSVQNDIIIQQTQLAQNEQSIGMVVKRQDNRPVSYYPKRAYFPATGDSSKLYYAIDESRYYEWKNGKYSVVNPQRLIDAGAITLAINAAGDAEATINAKKVTIGELNQEDLDTWAADAKNGEGVFAKFLTVRRLRAQEIETLLANIAYADIDDINVGTIGTEILTVEEGLTTAELYTEEINEMPAGDFIARAEVVGDVLTLYPVDGDPITFKKATKVRGNWSGNTLTLSANAAGTELPYTSQISLQFYSNPTTPGNYQYNVAAYRQDNGAQQPTMITGASQQIQLGILEATPNIVRILTGSGGQILNTPTYTMQLEEKTITANGTYMPATGYSGFSKLVVSVPNQGYLNPVSVFSANSGQYYIVSKDNGNEITGSNVNYKMGVLAASPTIVRLLNPAGDAQVAGSTPTYTIPLTTRSITSNGTYTPASGNVGFSSVSVNVPQGYFNPKAVFSASSGQYYIVAKDGNNEITGSSVTYKLGESNGKVQIQNTSGTKIGSTPEYTIPTRTPTITGNAVADDQNDHNPGSITVSGTGITSRTQNLTITSGSWSGGKMATNIRFGDSTGPLIARKWNYMPNITESITNPAAFNFIITASCGGKSVRYKLVVKSTGGYSSFTKQ